MIKRSYLCITHPFATKSILYCYKIDSVRLACLRHTASVHPEPGSNSPKKMLFVGLTLKIQNFRDLLLLNCERAKKLISYIMIKRKSQTEKLFTTCFFSYSSSFF